MLGTRERNLRRVNPAHEQVTATDSFPQNQSGPVEWESIALLLTFAIRVLKILTLGKVCIQKQVS